MRTFILGLRAFVSIALMPLPWGLRRPLLGLLLGFRLHPKSHIGFALVLAERVVLEEGARIGHFTLVSPIGLIHLHAHATIGRGNKIMGGQQTHLYPNERSRVSALIMEEHSSLTREHYIDCTNTVTIGRFTVVAGWGSQFLTHSPDLSTSTQISAPLRIGAYCFLGTRIIILKDAVLPDYCVLSAGSVLRDAQSETHWLFSGVPAKAIMRLDANAQFFHRTHGHFD